MGFVRGCWKFLVALKDGMVLVLLLLFFGLLYAALSAGGNPAVVRDGALVLKLNGTIAEQPSAIDPIAALMSSSAPVNEFRQRDIIRALDLAITDDAVKAVVLDLDGFMGGGQVSLAAVGARLDAVKKAGKPVYSFATYYGDDAYHLAAHASTIWSDPLGGVMVTGPGGSQPYFKDLLDKVGVTAHVYRVGTYKSAVEPFIRNDQSPESKTAIKAVYDEVWAAYRADIAKARPQAQLDAMLNDPAGQLAAAQGDVAALALSTKLVDTLGDRIAFSKFVASKVGKDTEGSTGGFAAIPAAALLAKHGPERGGDTIGVVTIAGTIIDGKAGPGTAGGETVSELIYSALDKQDLKALVVRVDSPGGSVLASEQIRLAINAAKAKKIPVVVSMANLAASGGYWVSLPADAIFAEPATITGSIGIFGVIPSGEKAFAKIGVNGDGVKTGVLSGEPDILGGFSPAFDQVAQSAIEKGYRDFITRVGTARKKSPEQVDAIAQGRVWAGGTARQIGLVDRFGGIDDALAEAAKRAGLKDKDDWHPVYLEPEASFASILLGDLVPARTATGPTDMFGHAALHQQMAWDRIAADLQMLTSVRSAQVRCLECGMIAGAPVAPAQTPPDNGWLSLVMRWLG